MLLFKLRLQPDEKRPVYVSQWKSCFYCLFNVPTLVLYGVSLDLCSVRNLVNLKVILSEHVQYQFSVTHQI